jgi:hypothetical protein
MKTSFICIEKNYKCVQNTDGHLVVEVVLVPSLKDPVKGGTIRFVGDEATLASIKPNVKYIINIKEEG